MDIKRALPRPELRSVVRSFEERRADLGSAVLTWPVAARPHQILDIHLAEPYQVRIDGGPAKTSPETAVVGPQTYRRAHVHLSCQIHVFNILFQPTGLNRLVGINMTSLVNQDPGSLGCSRQSRCGSRRRRVRGTGLPTPCRRRRTLGRDDAGQGRPGRHDRPRVAPDDRTPGPCADRGPRCKIWPQYQSVPASFCYPSRDDAKTVCTNDPV